MSLNDEFDDDYQEIIPKSKKKNQSQKFELKKIITNKYFLTLIVGIIIGIIFAYGFIEINISNNYSEKLTNCNLEKQTLISENYCLYEILPDPKETINTCKQSTINEE
jgi:hypothetical protein